MKKKVIYMVEGSCGEYSDHTEWPVKAYFSKEKAEEHVENAQRRANELYATHNYYHEIKKGDNEFDPNMQADYTGTRYYTYEVELGD